MLPLLEAHGLKMSSNCWYFGSILKIIHIMHRFIALTCVGAISE
jgi:hypothetical protein